MRFLGLILGVLVSFSAFGQRTISGKVTNGETNEPLSFASIGVVGKAYGTVSNAEGAFTFKVPAGLENDTLMCSYIGFSTYRMPVGKLPDEELQIALQPSSVTLSEIVITDRTAEDYIRAAVNKIPQNYQSDCYQTAGYYSEYLKENQTYLSNTELLTRIVLPEYKVGDTTQKTQVKILQGRVRDDLGEAQFMKEKREKKLDEDDGDPFEVDGLFGSPEDVLAFDPVRRLEPFLKEENLRDYRYTLEPPVKYQDQNLVVIRFKSRGKVDRIKSAGRVYLEAISDAIVAVEYDGKAVIPLAIKPLLALFGIGIKNPVFIKTVRYRKLGDRWVLESLWLIFDAHLVEKHLFKKNEDFLYQAEKLFVATNFSTENVKDIPKSERFDPKKPLKEQFPPENPALWQQYNTVRPKKITK